MDLIMQLNLKLTKLLCNVGGHNIITLRKLMGICRGCGWVIINILQCIRMLRMIMMVKELNLDQDERKGELILYHVLLSARLSRCDTVLII